MKTISSAQLTIRPLDLVRVIIRRGIPNYDKKGGIHPILEMYQVRTILDA